MDVRSLFSFVSLLEVNLSQQKTIEHVGRPYRTPPGLRLKPDQSKELNIDFHIYNTQLKQYNMNCDFISPGIVVDTDSGGSGGARFQRPSRHLCGTDEDFRLILHNS
jgi:hypothetical protein